MNSDVRYKRVLEDEKNEMEIVVYEAENDENGVKCKIKEYFLAKINKFQ